MSDARIAVRVQAGAGRDELSLRDGRLIARVSAPALEGRANRAVCRLIAGRLRVAPTRVTIARGERSREKLLVIQGLEQSDAERLLAGP